MPPVCITTVAPLSGAGERAALLKAVLAADQPFDGLGKLPLLGRPLAGADRLAHAVFGVIPEQDQRDALQPCPGGVDLRQHVDAVAVLLDHLLDASDLALDPAQASDYAGLVVAVSRHAG